MGAVANPLAARAVEDQIRVIDLGMDWSTGDRVSGYASTVPGQRQEIKAGSTASPLMTSGPMVKVSRTGAVTQETIETVGSVGTDGCDQLAALMGISRGTAAEEVQGVGVTGFAYTESTVGSPGNDACGVYGVGWSKAASEGSLGVGGVFVGRTESATGKITALETSTYNGSGVDGVLAEAGASNMKGLWSNAAGNADSAVAWQIGNAFGRQFLYAIHANKQVTGGKTGGIKEGFIRDQSTAKRSIWIQGEHAEGALVVEKGSGQVVIGASKPQQATPLLEIYSESAVDPMISIGSDKNVSISSQLIRNSAGNLKAFAAASANNFMTGTAQGDTGAAFTPGKIFHLGASTKTSMFRVAEAGLGFYGTAPQAKPEVTGSRGGNAALASLLEKLAAVGLVTNGSTA